MQAGRHRVGGRLLQEEFNHPDDVGGSEEPGSDGHPDPQGKDGEGVQEPHDRATVTIT